VQAGLNGVGLKLDSVSGMWCCVEKLSGLLSSIHSGRDWDFYLVLVLGPFASDEG
jgi:hypothetical protein